MIWAEVYDAAGNRLGAGPIRTLTQLSITRALDGAGSFDFTVPAHDPRVAELLQPERRVRFYRDQGSTIREVGRGIIRKLNYTASASGWQITVSGTDALDELKRRSVLLNRAYNNTTVAAVVSDLVGLVGGWSALSSVATLLSARFDAVSVLKALQEVIKLQGLHLRLTSGNTVEVGALGSSSGLILLTAQQITAGMTNNPQVAFIERLQETQASQEIINRLYVLGAGANVDSAFTLTASTRTTPYPIHSTTVNGRTLLYIEDTASVAAYGVCERVGQFREIAPLTNGTTDTARAANALYDAAAAWLARYSQPQTSYSVSVPSSPLIPLPGDKLRLMYHDPIPREDGSVAPPRNIDAEFWVLRVTEQLGATSQKLTLEISTVDRYEASIAKTVIGSLDQLRVQNMLVQPTITHFQAGPEQVNIDPANAGKVQLILTDATFSVDRVLMRVRTQPFTSTAKSAQSVTSASGGGTTSSAGGNHRHLMFKSTGVTGSAATFNYRFYTAARANGNQDLSAYLYQSPDSSDVYTYDSSGEHTHDNPNHTHDIPPAPLAYGIYKDNQRPADITITVNGINVTPSPIGTTGDDLDTTLNITEAIINKAGGFRTAHDVGLTCGAGQGEVLVTFDVYETITPFRFGS
jgi:hypothetical protein